MSTETMAGTRDTHKYSVAFIDIELLDNITIVKAMLTSTLKLAYKH